MKLERKQDRSIYTFLEDLFTAYSTVSIEDGFPEQDLSLPTVVIEAGDIIASSSEMGNRAKGRIRDWSIDIYASNKEQRDEMVSIVLDGLDAGAIPVYNYDEGFVSPSQLGTMSILDDVVATNIKIFPELMERLYWRNRVRFITNYNEF